MPTRNVVLTDQQSKLVDKLVASGRYQNASEVLRDGLRRVERDDALAQAQLKALREAARVGIADVEAGRFRSFGSENDLAGYLTGLADAALKAQTVKASE